MSEQQTPDREKKIAEIKKFCSKDYSIVPARRARGWCEFLLSELERLEREYAEERAAHNAHVTELCELEKENRKLRERLKEELVWQDECLKLEEQLQSAQQDRDKLVECLRFYERLTRGREVNDGGRRARTILAEIGVTVE